MPLYLYDNIYESGSVLEGWKPVKGGSIKYPVRNQSVKKIFECYCLENGRKLLRKEIQVKFIISNTNPDKLLE